MTFAVFGTLVSALITGYGLYLFAYFNILSLNNSNPLECLLFGALLSSTDPVATLAIFSSKAVDAPPLLYSLVFGESVLNDAVSIVLYKTLEGFLERGEFSQINVLEALLAFFAISIGSLLVGVFMALILSAITKRIDLTESASPYYEVTSVILVSYASYFVSEALNLIGIMALFFCSLTLAHYNFYNISEEAQITTNCIFKSLAQMCETFVFIYLGIKAGMSFSSASTLVWNPVLISITMGLILVSRAIHVSFFSFILNLSRSVSIPWRMQVVIWFAGLRGAIAFALSLQVPTDNANIIITSTLGIVLITTIILGPLTEPLIRYLGMRGSDWKEENHETSLIKNASHNPSNSSKVAFTIYSTDSTTPAYSQIPSNSLLSPEPQSIKAADKPANLKERSEIAKFWFKIDNDYLKPMFGGRTRSIIPPTPLTHHDISVLDSKHSGEHHQSKFLELPSAHTVPHSIRSSKILSRPDSQNSIAAADPQHISINPGNKL